jgi:hypothetical protein
METIIIFAIYCAIAMLVTFAIIFATDEKRVTYTRKRKRANKRAKMLQSGNYTILKSNI